MFLGPGTLSRRLAVALWMLRALWASMLLSPLVLYACATWLTDELTDAIAKGATWIDWVEGPPWGTWLLAAAVALGSILIPPAIERRSVARLRARIGRAVDPSRPGSYRNSPRIISEYSDAMIEAACARYASRLALSFAMLGAVVLLLVGGFANPTFVSGLGFACRYFWRPVDYLPAAALVSVLVATQFPTMHRMLRTLQSLAGTNG
jgi:hypothetical protein